MNRGESSMRWSFIRIAVPALAVAAIGTAGNAQAAVSYSVAGDVYSEDFNAPKFPANSNPLNLDGNGDPVGIQYNQQAHIQNGNTPWPGGWKDNYARDETYLGLPGWYLHHESTIGTPVLDEEGNTKWYTTGGANGHAQFRFGGGNSPSVSPTTGQQVGGNGGTGFFSFAVTNCLTCGERALGVRSAGVFGRMYIGLQLINDTGTTLNSFTITYDGEQYSEAASHPENGPFDPDGFDLQWSLVADATNWGSSTAGVGFYDGVSGVDYGGFADSFVSPINDNNPEFNLATVNTILYPNNAVRDITHTVTGIEWAPGAELWIRWRDTLGIHDGIAIDNVRFSAIAAVGPELDGDFNGDGSIDAADYVVWRKSYPGTYTQADYDAWVTNFGTNVGGGSGGAVPEPSTLLCGAFAIALGLASRRKR